MPLRYYQDDAKSAVEFALEEFDRVLLNLPTGAGKTVVAAHLIADFLPKRCLFLADQDELCTQPLTVIDREAGIIPAIDKAKDVAALTAKVVVASSQTLSRKSRLERFPPRWFDYAIVDEAHRGADRDAKITDHLAKKVIGITATPFRANLRDLSKYYQEVAYALPMLDLIADGFAPKLNVQTIPLEIDLAGVETKKVFGSKDYDAESLSTTIAPYYEQAAIMLKEHAANRHTLVFLPLIKSSEAFAAIARAAGISAVHVDGKDPEREDKIRSFAAGRIQMLCNADLLSTGVDIPIADCLVNLTPTRSMVLYQQRVGRILRVLPGVIDDIPGRHQAADRCARIAASAKPDALIIDFLWQHDKLGVMHPGHLVVQNEADAKAMFEKTKANRTPEDLQRIAQLVQEERESLLVKKLEEVATQKGGRSVEPAAFGFLIGSQSIISYDPVGGWEVQPPSDAQLRKLGEWGIDVSKVSTKGLASKLMEACIHRFKFRLASINQLRAIAQLGIPVNPRKLSSRDASRLIAETKLATVRETSI